MLSLLSIFGNGFRPNNGKAILLVNNIIIPVLILTAFTFFIIKKKVEVGYCD